MTKNFQRGFSLNYHLKQPLSNFLFSDQNSIIKIKQLAYRQGEAFSCCIPGIGFIFQSYQRCSNYFLIEHIGKNVLFDKKILWTYQLALQPFSQVDFLEELMDREKYSSMILYKTENYDMVSFNKNKKENQQMEEYDIYTRVYNQKDGSLQFTSTSVEFPKPNTIKALYQALYLVYGKNRKIQILRKDAEGTFSLVTNNSSEINKYLLKHTDNRHYVTIKFTEEKSEDLKKNQIEKN